MMKMFVPFMLLMGSKLLFKSNFLIWSVTDFLIFGLLIILSSYSVYEKEILVAEWWVLDSLSFGLVTLSLFLFILMFLSSSLIVNKHSAEDFYYSWLIVLALSLICGFMSGNYFMFYVMFEISLIPTLFIIVGWGAQPERLQAGVYFLMYTLLASLPLLFGLVYLSNSALNMEMWDSLLLHYGGKGEGLSNVLLSVVLVSAFLVKLPMFLVHLWLPKAHVEAPVAGSMILAGVLLKLGGFGLIRVLPSVIYTLQGLTSLLISLSLLGMGFIGLVCCRLNDFKSLVAYSSVSHMALVLSGIMSFSSWGVNGGLMMMISHGVGSSGLFCFVNLLYERIGSRSMVLNSGVVGVTPIFSLFMFLLCCSNISAPPTINLLSEISLIIGINGVEGLTMMIFPIGSFLGAVFTFYMFSLSQHGKDNFEAFSTSSGGVIEYHLLGMHVLPINLLILKNNLFFEVF